MGKRVGLLTVPLASVRGGQIKGLLTGALHRDPGGKRVVASGTPDEVPSMIEKRFRAPPGSRVHSAVLRRILTSDVVLRDGVARFIGGITLMPNNICNAKCVFCSYQFNIDPKRTMSLELFRRALDSTMEMGHVGTVVLTPHAGEPLADPHLFEKIDYAHKQGVERVIFTTNGILLGRDENYKKVIDSDLYEVNVSTPGLDPAAYERLFQVKKYDDVIAGLVKLAEYKAARGAASRTRIQLIVHLDRPVEVAMQEEGWKVIQPYLDTGILRLLGTSSDFDNWSGIIDADNLLDGMSVRYAKHDSTAPPCERLIHDLAVLPDGKVRVCSCRYLRTDHDELVIGDVTTTPMKDIYYGEAHRALIRRIASGDWPEVCRTCSLYRPATIESEQMKRLYRIAIGDSAGSHWAKCLPTGPTLAAE